MAISALPPLNGFVSEWLTFQAILLSPAAAVTGARSSWCRLSARCWRLSAALAAACFVKAFGVTFLGRPRTHVAANAQETDRVSLAAMFCFAALCLLAGILPGPVHRCAGAGERRRSSATACRRRSAPQWLSIVPIAESRSSYNGLLVFVFIGHLGALAASAIHRFASRRGAPRPGLGLRLS